MPGFRREDGQFSVGGGLNGTTNVVLEGTDKLVSTLVKAGRCYIKWFSFWVRPDNPFAGCFRCEDFDHRVAECRAKSDVCRRWGQESHKTAACGMHLIVATVDLRVSQLGI